MFTAAATAGVGVGKRVADRVEPESLQRSFAALLVALAIYTGARALLAIFDHRPTRRHRTDFTRRIELDTTYDGCCQFGAEQAPGSVELQRRGFSPGASR